MINHEEINKLIDVKEVEFLKMEAVRKQEYELATELRSRQKFIESDEGQKYLENLKREERK